MEYSEAITTLMNLIADTDKEISYFQNLLNDAYKKRNYSIQKKQQLKSLIKEIININNNKM